jgi:hypothetical protein
MRGFSRTSSPSYRPASSRRRKRAAAKSAIAENESPVTHQFGNVKLFPDSAGIQAKLKINTPGDKYEQEANSVADSIVNQPEMQPANGLSLNDKAEHALQNNAAGYDGVMAKRNDDGVLGGEQAPPGIDEMAPSGGKPLDAGTRDFFEHRFGNNFGHVRIHADNDAAKAAQSIEARAFTLGRKVVFGAGEYAPGTTEGKRLIAHELTHVLQQGQSKKSNQNLRQSNAAVKTTGANAGTVYRQETPPGEGTVLRRLVYPDYSVFNQINRGNEAIAAAMNNLRNSGAEIRISSWTYREMVLQPTFPQTVTANLRLIQDLNIPVDAEVPFVQRVDYALPNQRKNGQPIIAPEDAQVVVGAKAGGGEVWFAEKAARNDPNNIEKTFGIKVAPESTLPLAAVSPKEDYKIGRKLLNLQEIEISDSGVVTEPTPRNGGGGGRGAPPVGTPPPPPPPPAGGGAPPNQGNAQRQLPPVEGAQTPRVPPAAEVAPANRAVALERQKLLLTLSLEARRSAAFSARFGAYVKIGNGLLTALGYINTVNDILSMANSGTVLGDAQTTANQVVANSIEAQNRVEEIFNTISPVTVGIQVGDAILKGDRTGLIALGDSLNDFGMDISKQAYHYGELSRGLRARAEVLNMLSEFYGKIKYLPVAGFSSLPQTSAFNMEESLRLLSVTLGIAATNYDDARERLSPLVTIIVEFGHRADLTAMGIALRQAEIEQQRNAPPPNLQQPPQQTQGKPPAPGAH